MTVKTEKIRSAAVGAVWAVLVITLFMGVLADGLGIPYAIRYLNDLLVLFLLALLISEKGLVEKVRRCHICGVLAAMLLYTVVNVLSLAVNGGKLPLVLWAVRNTYRFFVFYVACVFYLKKKDIEVFFTFLYWLQWVNMALVLYQFFALGLKQDYLGGIFGHGANAAMLIFCLLLLAYAMPMYIHGEYSLGKFLFIFASTVLCSVLAEIRVFVFFVLMILGMNMLPHGNWKRKVTAVLIGIVLAIMSYFIYAAVFPYVSFSVGDLVAEGMSQSVDSIQAGVSQDAGAVTESASQDAGAVTEGASQNAGAVTEGASQNTGAVTEGVSQTGGYNISRLNAFHDINRIFFRGDWLENLLGYGFGNCESSSYPIFTSQFYRDYGVYHYRWFAHQWIFLETGYAGVISYLSILGAIIYHSWRRRKMLSKSSMLLNMASLAIALSCVPMFIYNALLKIDYAYLAFFGMAVSGIVIKEQITSSKDITE